MKPVPHIACKPMTVKARYRDVEVTVPVHGVVVPQKDGTYWGMHPASIRGKILVIPEDQRSDLVEESKQMLGDTTQREALQKLIDCINTVAWEKQPRVDTGTPQRRMYDIGDEARWQYLHNSNWLLNANRALKHPSLAIERIRLADGWHLAVVLYQTW